MIRYPIKRKVVLVLTGSVATTVCKKLVKTFLSDDYALTVVLTERAKYFLPESTLFWLSVTVPVYSNESEWAGKHYVKDAKIPHIELAKNNDLLLICPASADFLAKMANGLCDDLASSLYRAWHRDRPVYICPAMNDIMYSHPITQEHLNKLRSWGNIIIEPISKKLACGDEGIGALEDIDKIKYEIDDYFSLFPPLKAIRGIPIGQHQGAYLAERKHSPHTGVDLYAEYMDSVRAMSDGVVISVEDFTGFFDNSPWWNDTQCVLIQHWFGVVCYGEIQPSTISGIEAGAVVRKGQNIGHVLQVLKDGKERPDIQGHSKCMLHLELYPEGTCHASRTYELDKDLLRDPTPWIRMAYPDAKELKG